VTGSNFPAVLTDDPSTVTINDPTVTAVTAAPLVTARKTAVLFTDADGNGVPSPGDTLLYQIRVRNTGNVAATGVSFTDTPDSNTTLVVGSVQTNAGTVTSGNSVGNTSVGVNIGTPAADPIAVTTISFAVTINSPLPAGVTTVSNQGQVAGTNFSTGPYGQSGHRDDRRCDGDGSDCRAAGDGA
jgi:large repetitive protein